jgi:sn-glycerol 3-phosphate transport system substrate-binding protein
MPFNASTPILYYNKDAFKEVGLDPNKPPVTFTEIADAAKKLTKKDASGRDRPLRLRSVDLRLALRAAHGDVRLALRDNGNGRDNRATKVVYNNAAGKAILDWWKAGVDGGYFFNPGIDNDGAGERFNAQKTAMYIESTARLRGHITTIAGKWELGTGLYPRPDSKPKRAATSSAAPRSTS